MNEWTEMYYIHSFIHLLYMLVPKFQVQISWQSGWNKKPDVLYMAAKAAVGDVVGLHKVGIWSLECYHFCLAFIQTTSGAEKPAWFANTMISLPWKEGSLNKTTAFPYFFTQQPPPLLDNGFLRLRCAQI